METLKEKNIITYIRDDGRKYRFDINTLIFYGLSGKPITRIPSEIKLKSDSSPVEAMVNLMFNSGYGRCSNIWKKRIALADKLTSMGFVTSQISAFEIRYYADIVDSKKFGVDITEKKILNFIKKRIEEGEGVELGYFYEELREEQLRKAVKIELSETDKTLVVGLMDYFELEQIGLISHWINRGLGYLYSYDFIRIKRTISDFFDKAKYLEYTPTKEDFARQLILVSKNYETRKTEIDNKRLFEHQTKYNLNFENDDFIVVVPTTATEFEQEGNAQSNCVFTSYLSQVINGKTNIVFIRKKTDVTKSYITCEISRRGYINQYLGRCNNVVREEKAIAFYNEYENYLKTLNINY